VNAPAILTNHREIVLPLIFRQSGKCFNPFFWTEAATGAAVTDALPVKVLSFHHDCCDKRSQWTSIKDALGDNAP
tara:strand:+ start:389 stop:613 length:225 start_codon:yes stop_codon:yes gene_type:complete